MNSMKVDFERKTESDVHRHFNKMPKDIRIFTMQFFNNELKMKYCKHIIDPNRIWFDINRDEIIKTLSQDKKYDIYIITKRGRIKVFRSKKFLNVIALRFRYYKKYMVIAEVFVPQKEEAAQEPVEEVEIQTA
jgi:hypothetical protein